MTARPDYEAEYWDALRRCRGGDHAFYDRGSGPGTCCCGVYHFDAGGAPFGFYEYVARDGAETLAAIADRLGGGNQ